MPRRIRKPVKLHLERDKFCQVWEKNAYECARGFHIFADDDHYNLLYQNGAFRGLVRPNGGVIYPFSRNPKWRGFHSRNKHILNAKVVCISKAFIFKMEWGTGPDAVIALQDQDGKTHKFGARGSLYLHLDATDYAKSADTFYRSLLAQGDASNMDVFDIKKVILDSFVNLIGAEIEKLLIHSGRPIEQIKSLSPTERATISNNAFDSLVPIFKHFGLTLDEECKGSLMANLHIVHEKEDSPLPPPPPIPPFMF